MKIRLLKFESKTCGSCIAMNKKRIVEMIREEFPLHLEVITLIIADKHGNSPEGSRFEEAYSLSDELSVTQLPTFIMQDEQGLEIGRLEGEHKLVEFRKAIESLIKQNEEEANAIAAAAMLRQRINAFQRDPQE